MLNQNGRPSYLEMSTKKTVTNKTVEGTNIIIVKNTLKKVKGLNRATSTILIYNLAE